MSFNFGKFKDLMGKFGALGKWNKSMNRMERGIVSMKITDPSNGQVITMIPKGGAGSAQHVVKALIAGQTVDAAIDALAATPINTVFKSVQALQALPAKYTLGLIPGFKQFFDWINDKVLGVIKWMAQEAGFQGVAKATDNYQQLWQEGFKAIGDNSGYKGGNADYWWQETGKRVRVDKGILANVGGENSGANPTNKKKVLGSLVIFTDSLPTVAARTYQGASGVVNPFNVAINEAITKYLTYMNFTQTLTDTAIGNYLEAVADLYGYYISHKKYYNSRKAPIVEGQLFRWDTIVKGCIINSKMMGSRSSMSTQDNTYWHIDEYVADKDWDSVEVFLERQYLPKNIREYIEYSYGCYWKYSSDVNTLVAIDSEEFKNTLPGTAGSRSILGKYQALIAAVNTATSSVTANLKGFLAKMGMPRLVCPEWAKKARSKAGEDDLMIREADDLMKSAINNILTAGPEDADSYGYRYNASEDSMIIDAGVMTTVKPVKNLDFRDISLDSEEANHLSKLLKYQFYADFYAIGGWRSFYNNVTNAIEFASGIGFRCDNVQQDWTLGGGLSSLTAAQITAAINALAAQAGSQNEPSFSDVTGIHYPFDYCFHMSINPAGQASIGVTATASLTQMSEVKVYQYKRVRETACYSLAYDNQYLQNLQKFVDELNAAIDVQL